MNITSARYYILTFCTVSMAPDALARASAAPLVGALVGFLRNITGVQSLCSAIIV